MLRTIAYVILVVLIASIMVSSYATGAELGDEVFTRAVVSKGDTGRLQKVMQKSAGGKEIVIGTIGGSITQGASATSSDKNWSSLVAKWWQASFPECKVKLVNAGIGATGSLIGSHRAYRDLLAQNPDLVICEFSVNDANDQLAAETLEGLVRQSLNSKNKPAVVLLFTMDINGGNAQEWHSRVGSHYKLPMISARDALVPEIQAGKMKWTDILADQVHPNDAGHAYYAQFITHLFDEVKVDLTTSSKAARISRIPKPLFSDIFEHTAIYNADNLVPKSNYGWGYADVWCFGKGWSADKPGAQLEFEVAGDTVSIMYFKIKNNLGIALAQVDNHEPVKLDGWFDQDWGGYSCYAVLGRKLGAGMHKVKITVTDEKAEASNGHHFEVHSILAAGITK